MHECGGQRTLQSNSLDSSLVQCDEQLKKHSSLTYFYYERKSHCSSPSFNLNKNWTNETFLGLFWLCWLLTTRSNLFTPHGFICPLCSHSRCQPWVTLPLLWGGGTHTCWGWDAALMPSSGAAPDSALLLFQGKLKAFLLGLGKPLVQGMVGRRQNRMGNAAGRRENAKNESLAPRAQYLLITP